MNTMQQEFDAVVEHLYKQGKPAKRADGKCVYRTEDGLACAVGCRLPIYLPEMDEACTGFNSTGVVYLNTRFSNVLPPEIAAYTPMFKSLQRVHDCCPLDEEGMFHLGSLSSMLVTIADNLGLTFKAPQ